MHTVFAMCSTHTVARAPFIDCRPLCTCYACPCLQTQQLANAMKTAGEPSHAASQPAATKPSKRARQTHGAQSQPQPQLRTSLHGASQPQGPSQLPSGPLMHASGVDSDPGLTPSAVLLKQQLDQLQQVSAQVQQLQTQLASQLQSVPLLQTALAQQQQQQLQSLPQQQCPLPLSLSGQLPMSLQLLQLQTSHPLQAPGGLLMHQHSEGITGPSRNPSPGPLSTPPHSPLTCLQQQPSRHSATFQLQQGLSGLQLQSPMQHARHSSPLQSQQLPASIQLPPSMQISAPMQLQHLPQPPLQPSPQHSGQLPQPLHLQHLPPAQLQPSPQQSEQLPQPMQLQLPPKPTEPPGPDLSDLERLQRMSIPDMPPGSPGQVDIDDILGVLDDQILPDAPAATEAEVRATPATLPQVQPWQPSTNGCCGPSTATSGCCGGAGAGASAGSGSAHTGAHSSAHSAHASPAGNTPASAPPAHASPPGDPNSPSPHSRLHRTSTSAAPSHGTPADAHMPDSLVGFTADGQVLNVTQTQAAGSGWGGMSLQQMQQQECMPPQQQQQLQEPQFPQQLPSFANLFDRPSSTFERPSQQMQVDDPGFGRTSFGWLIDELSNTGPDGMMAHQAPEPAAAPVPPATDAAPFMSSALFPQHVGPQQSQQQPQASQQQPSRPPQAVQRAGSAPAPAKGITVLDLEDIPPPPLGLPPATGSQPQEQAGQQRTSLQVPPPPLASTPAPQQTQTQLEQASPLARQPSGQPAAGLQPPGMPAAAQYLQEHQHQFAEQQTAVLQLIAKQQQMMAQAQALQAQAQAQMQRQASAQQGEVPPQLQRTSPSATQVCGQQGLLPPQLQRVSPTAGHTAMQQVQLPPHLQRISPSATQGFAQSALLPPQLQRLSPSATQGYGLAVATAATAAQGHMCEAGGRCSSDGTSDFARSGAHHPAPGSLFSGPCCTQQPLNALAAPHAQAVSPLSPHRAPKRSFSGAQANMSVDMGSVPAPVSALGPLDVHGHDASPRHALRRQGTASSIPAAPMARQGSSAARSFHAHAHTAPVATGSICSSGMSEGHSRPASAAAPLVQALADQMEQMRQLQAQQAAASAQQQQMLEVLHQQLMERVRRGER